METEPNFDPEIDQSTWYRSCNEEILNPIFGKTTGQIPSWLNGVLIRNGPGLFEFGDTEIKHVFDGMALLHRFEIKNGIVSYQCRFLQSDVYKKNKNANRIVVTGFGTSSIPDPCQTIFHRMVSFFNFNQNATDNAVVSVYPFGDEVYSFAETGVIYKVDKDNLETKNKIDFAKDLGIVTHTAHPHVTEDGSVYNLAMSVSRSGPVYHIVCFPSKSKKDNDGYSMFDKAHIVATVPSRWSLHPSYMHSFGITEKYFIIIEHPLCIVAPKIFIKTFLNMPARSLINWYNEMTKINVINRESGELVKEFYSKTFFYFHVINQYEDLDNIILDVCTYDEAEVIDCMYIDALKNISSNPNYASRIRSTPQRFVLPLRENKANFALNENLITIPNTTAKAFLLKDGRIIVQPELICDINCDLPTIYYDQFIGKPYRFFYAVSPSIGAVIPNAILKVDVDQKTNLTWYENDCYPSEPIFLPSPNPKSEDDGVILSSLIYRENENRIGLLVLCSKTFEEIGRVQFETLSSSPRTFHGWYFPTN